MTKGSPDYEKRPVSIKGVRVASFSTKGDPVTLGGRVKKTLFLKEISRHTISLLSGPMR
jgi:hypothetical protein